MFLKKVIGKLLRPIIKREVMKFMKDLVQPFIDLIKVILQREKGTKFLVCISAIGGIIYLTTTGTAIHWTVITGIVIVAGGYFFTDYKAKNKKPEEKE